MLELVSKARTIRRFDTSKTITDADLMHVLECARRVASAGNLQRLRYVTVNGEAAKSSFSNISLGGFLPPEKKPTEAVAPTAYVVISSYTDEPDANLLIDVGISAEAMVLAAAEMGIAACMIRNFNKAHFTFEKEGKTAFPILVIALGYPAETAMAVDVNDGESLKYYKNDEDVNVVPKLMLEDLIFHKYD